MKKNVISTLTVLLLLVQFGVPGAAYAWKPKSPFCVINCSIPLGKISAAPNVVVLASGGSVGSTQLKWFWDFSSRDPRKALFQLACVYVRVDANAHASVVQCEWPGHTYNTNIPWIAAGTMYTFILSPYVGDSVSVDSLLQIVAVPGEVTRVDVTGVSP